MTVAILGGAGYIGSHVVKYLQQQGIPVAVYDNLSQGHQHLIQAPLTVGEIGDQERLRDFCKRHQIRSVMNFAGLIAVGESVLNPRLYYAHNLTQTLSMLDVLLDLGIREFVFSSSCAIYGSPQFLPLTEDHPFAPISPYGHAKMMVEQVLLDYARAYDFKYVSLRYFNASGADPENQIGELHQPETHLIPLVLQGLQSLQSMQNLQPVQIYGTDYDTPDGTCIRDYIHVWDLAQAHYLALQHLRQHAASAVFNLGNSVGYSVREVIQAVERVTGLRVPSLAAPRRVGDPPILIGSSAKARQDLQWRPAFSDLETIIQTAWAWQQQAQTVAEKRVS